MQPDQPAAADDQGFAASALLWLQLLTLAVGALQFAFVPATVERPLLAAVALALLTISMLLARTVPGSAASALTSALVDIVALLVCITLLAAATGAARSPLRDAVSCPARRRRTRVRSLVARAAAWRS